MREKIYQVSIKNYMFSLKMLFFYLCLGGIVLSIFGCGKSTVSQDQLEKKYNKLREIEDNIIPLPTNVMIKNNIVDIYDGKYLYSKLGDHHYDEWDKNSASIYHSLSSKKILSTLNNKIFKDKIAIDYKQSNEEICNLLLNCQIQNQSIDHTAKSKSELGFVTEINDKVSPINVYCVATNVKISYEYLSKNGSTISSGVVYGSGQTEGKYQQEFGTKNNKSGCHRILKYSLNNAFVSAMTDASIDLIKELKSNKNIAKRIKEFERRKTSPSQLSTQLAYNDKDSIQPNNKINALERSSIIATVANQGPGKAYGVKLTIDSKSSTIEVPQTVTIGDIPPNNSQKVTIPLKGKRNLTSGTATINVHAKEDRGHHARPVKLKIDTDALKPPKLALTNALLEDSAGLAKGDGDQQPENTETIQVEPILKNRGSGQALDVEVRLTQVSKGVEIVQGKANVEQLSPGEVARPHLAFRIPHSFDRSQLKYTINAKDTRGITTQKNYQQSFIPQQPEVAATHQVVNRLGKPVSTLKNGKNYQLQITPKNHGNNYAKDIRIQIENYPRQIEIQDSTSHQIKELPPQSEGSTWSVPFVLSRSFTKDQAKIKLTYKQSHFPNTHQTLEWPVRVRSPELSQRVELLQGGSSKGEIPLTSRPTFRISITNRGTMEALDVKTAFSVQQGDFSKEMGKKIGKLPPGQTAYRDFEFYVPGDVEPGKLTIDLVVTQSDFPDHKSELAGNYQFVPQTAKVQKVSGTTSATDGSTLDQATPPEVRFLTPSKGMSTKKSELPVEAILLAFGWGNAIDRVSATLNGNQLPVRSSCASEQEGTCLTRSNTEQKKLTVKGQIPLKSGSNKLILKAIDRNGRSQKQTLTFSYNKPKTLAERIASLEPRSTSKNRYLLAVGISDYAHVPNVDYAEKSTEFFLKAARKIWGIPSENITTLLGSEASGTYLKAQLEKIVNRIDDGDTLYFYYAGHGVPAPDKERVYILPQDATEEAYKDSELALDRLYQIFGESSAKRVITFIDACFSGRIGEEQQLFKGTAPAALVSKQTLKQNVPQNMTIFTAGDEDDFANSYDSKQHRLFSYYLIEGLLKQPKDLHSYVAERVEERSRAKGMAYTQEPKVYGEKYISW